MFLLSLEFLKIIITYLFDKVESLETKIGQKSKIRPWSKVKENKKSVKSQNLQSQKVGSLEQCKRIEVHKIKQRWKSNSKKTCH